MWQVQINQRGCSGHRYENSEVVGSQVSSEGCELVDLRVPIGFRCDIFGDMSLCPENSNVKGGRNRGIKLSYSLDELLVYLGLGGAFDHVDDGILAIEVYKNRCRWVVRGWGGVRVDPP